MPRGPRLDFPAALHHVIARGIERREIFHDDSDRVDCVARLSDLVSETGAALYAWALMPNHAHLLLRTGTLPLSRLIQRWLSGYATRFNLVHTRAGHLFQHRFRSVLVDEEEHLLNLVRYIHLNPVRSRLSVTIDDLDGYRWTGHSVLLGNVELAAQDTAYVLGRFGNGVGAARAAYRRFVRTGADDATCIDLDGGGLRRSADGGGKSVPSLGRGRESWSFDERILGGPDFVEGIWMECESLLSGAVFWPEEPIEASARRVADFLHLPLEQLCSPRQTHAVLDGRAMLCQIGVEYYRLSLTATGRLVRVSRQSVARALERTSEVSTRIGRSPRSFVR